MAYMPRFNKQYSILSGSNLFSRSWKRCLFESIFDYLKEQPIRGGISYYGALLCCTYSMASGISRSAAAAPVGKLQDLTPTTKPCPIDVTQYRDLQPMLGRDSYLSDRQKRSADQISNSLKL